MISTTNARRRGGQRTLASALLGLWLLLGLLVPSMAAAASPSANAGEPRENTGEFVWLLGDALNDPEGDDDFTAVSFAADGSSIEMAGVGEFSVGRGPNEVSGGGSYIVRDADGEVTDEGSWEAARLTGYNSHGCVVMDGDTFCTGVLRAQVKLDGLGVGQIWITCLGPGSPPNAAGGFRLDLRVGPNFNEPAPHSGAVYVPLGDAGK